MPTAEERRIDLSSAKGQLLPRHEIVRKARRKDQGVRTREGGPFFLDEG